MDSLETATEKPTVLQPRTPMATTPQVKITTFGCKVNTYDSGLLQNRLRQDGFELSQQDQSLADQLGDQPDQPSFYILNSCAVTGAATAETIRQARRLKARQPESYVVVTGCSAQVDTEVLQQTKEIDLIVGNSHKGELSTLLRDLLHKKSIPRVYKSNIFNKEDLEPGGGEEQRHTRSFLKIQDGCDSFCTFCVIPFARGKSRSLSPEALSERILALEHTGVQEVVLTGVHIGDYCFSDQRLEDLIEHLLLHTRIPRLRLSSLEPIEISPRLLDLFQDRRLCPHFHMSLQSASSSVLNRMKRKYSGEQVQEALESIERQVAGAFVGLDIIAGFPQETDFEFAETLNRLRDSPWTRMHVFPYSSRPHTFAARMKGHLPPGIIKDRAFKLREISSERHVQTALSQIGKNKLILPLRGAQGVHSSWQGLSRDYWPVMMEASTFKNKQNLFLNQKELQVRITGSDRHEERAGSLKLYGVVVEALV